ncbi:hypothetical protein LOTGIDRAFT_143730 [Lottia gigantea]|uniref:Uncharacterized protein n=1 Tax=Lottia gigantea TaxID=225164 RepID=V4ASI4_LOTGI|nr:hypothetical protein LOTGIDRAFT_143730 [Lottia gigantea]ESO96696.1 hypothetical protein LOTGIDRAFT_143730 [Lottia gigantea]
MKTQRKRKTSHVLAPTEADLKQLKETATKLKLNTRRPSYLVWREEYIDKPKIQKSSDQFEVAKSTKCEKWTNDRQVRINDSLDWIRSQLAEMRRMDQNLAQQFLGIRREITRLKLKKSCEAHEDMLDDAAIGMEELQELSKVLDEPHGSYAPSPLKHLGVTKMNLSSRRFSTC